MGLSIGILPSLAIGIGAFGAGELLFKTTKAEKIDKGSFENVIKDAKLKNTQIAKLAPKIEDEEIVNDINEIHETVGKIIDTIESKPNKFKKMDNFFDYYLPTTINIINKYDEIENQRLTSEDSKRFMESTKKMIKNINQAMKKQLASLYQGEIIDADAEMKVFKSMLQTDGYYGEDFENKNKEV